MQFQSNYSTLGGRKSKNELLCKEKNKWESFCFLSLGILILRLINRIDWFTLTAKHFPLLYKNIYSLSDVVNSPHCLSIINLNKGKISLKHFKKVNTETCSKLKLNFSLPGRSAVHSPEASRTFRPVVSSNSTHEHVPWCAQLSRLPAYQFSVGTTETLDAAAVTTGCNALFVCLLKFQVLLQKG